MSIWDELRRGSASLRRDSTNPNPRGGARGSGQIYPGWEIPYEGMNIGLQPHATRAESPLTRRLQDFFMAQKGREKTMGELELEGTRRTMSDPWEQGSWAQKRDRFMDLKGRLAGDKQRNRFENMLARLFTEDRGGGGGTTFEGAMERLGDAPVLSDAAQDKDLRDMIYKQASTAFGDNTEFTKTAYGRLLSAQAAESTEAGIREYLRRAGGAHSAAAAATTAMLRGRGAMNLARAQLASRAQMRQEVGGLLDVLARSRGLEANMLMDERRLQASLLGKTMDFEERARQRKWDLFREFTGGMA